MDVGWIIFVDIYGCNFMYSFVEKVISFVGMDLRIFIEIGVFYSFVEI